jgi:hypothetical protein
MNYGARHWRNRVCLLLIVVIALLLHQGTASCQERVQSVGSAPSIAPVPVKPEEIAPTKPDSHQSGLVIGEGDLLQITLYGVPEFNQRVRVESSGEPESTVCITFTLLGPRPARVNDRRPPF